MRKANFVSRNIGLKLNESALRHIASLAISFVRSLSFDGFLVLFDVRAYRAPFSLKPLEISLGLFTKKKNDWIYFEDEVKYTAGAGSNRGRPFIVRRHFKPIKT